MYIASRSQFANAAMSMHSLVWPVCLFVSVAVHATLLVSVGMKNGSPAGSPAKAFTLVDFSPQALAMAPAENIAVRSAVVPDAAIPRAGQKNPVDKRGAMPSADKDISFAQSAPVFYKSSEVSHLAQLQLPLEGVMFSEELSLSGRLILDIAISDLGKVVNIEVIEASDVTGALRAHMLPLLRGAPFSPAYKDGKPVNSVRRVEFTLGVVIDDPAVRFTATVPPGFRPQMDERGNILKNQPKP